MFATAELIEVSTFRQSVSDNIEHDAQHILRDEAFGTLQEDAFRRDFSVNALYFDPNSQEIIDYVDGLEDLPTNELDASANLPFDSQKTQCEYCAVCRLIS